MKTRYSMESASLGSDELKIAFQAFHSAWSRITARYTRPEAVEAARTRLANRLGYATR
jgi:hypothetical protein